MYSTYLGGWTQDYAVGIALDGTGAAYVVGRTYSDDFPTVNPMTTTIYLGDFVGAYTASDIEAASVSINQTISPVSTTILPSHPDFTGEVMEIVFEAKEFIEDYGLLWDTTSHTYSVSGQFDDGVLFGGNGQVIMIWHRLGDGDGSGEIDIDDAVLLIGYIFASGSAPKPIEVGDVDCTNAVDIDDVVHLINYVFSGSALPGDPDGDGVPDC